MGRTFQSYIVIFTAVCVCALVLTTGCSHSKTNRGYLFRADWAFEYNRTPWIGCPPDSGCGDEEGDGSCTINNNGKNNGKGFRRHCGLNPNCTAKHPCCKTLGCGMWIDPSNPNSFTALNTPKACGLTPFCSPMKPCGLTPFCGKIPVPNPQLISMNNPYQTGTLTPAVGTPLGIQNGIPALQNLQPGIQNSPLNQLLPTPIIQKTGNPIPQQQGVPQNGTIPKPAALAGPGGTLISMGVVPGVSTITSGGLVAAVGVRTPYGIMTPAGVQLPNGTFNNGIVICACGLTPNCNAAHPCGMTPNCGGLVPLAAVSNNAVALASALSSPNAQNSGVINAGGAMVPVGGQINGMLVNPISGQPAYGLSMNGLPQAGYPPIGYTPSGYSPKYPRFDGLGIGMSPEQYAQLLGVNGNEEEQEGTEEQPAESPVTKSQMPVPRFHPVPSKPAFQRSEGLPVQRKTADIRQQTAEEETAAITGEKEYERIGGEELKRAYLEGMAAAMEEIEKELETRSEAQEQKQKTELAQAKVLKQAEKIQSKIKQPTAENTAEETERIRQEDVKLQARIGQEQLRLKQLQEIRLKEEQRIFAQQQKQKQISTVQTTSKAASKKDDEGLLSSAAGYFNGFTGKIRQEIGTLGSSIGLGSKESAKSNEQVQQTFLQKQPPKPMTISETKQRTNPQYNETASGILQAEYAHP